MKRSFKSCIVSLKIGLIGRSSSENSRGPFAAKSWQRMMICQRGHRPFWSPLNRAFSADKTVKIYAPKTAAGKRPVAIAFPRTHAAFHQRVKSPIPDLQRALFTLQNWKNRHVIRLLSVEMAICARRQRRERPRTTSPGSAALKMRARCDALESACLWQSAQWPICQKVPRSCTLKGVVLSLPLPPKQNEQVLGDDARVEF